MNLTHKTNPTERLKWFLSKVGSTLYRNDHGCDCQSCKDVLERGVFINDELHAHYCYDIECDFNAEGTPLRYFDTISERDAWVKNVQK